MNKTELARSLFDAFLSGDRERAEALLAADFTFSSPYDDAIDRASYFERCWPNRDAVRAIRIRSVAENESDAFVAYECETTGGGKFENAIADYSKVVELSPAYAGGYVGRAKAYEKLEGKSSNKAKEDFSKATKFGYSPR